MCPDIRHPESSTYRWKMLSVAVRTLRELLVLSMELSESDRRIRLGGWVRVVGKKMVLADMVFVGSCYVLDFVKFGSGVMDHPGSSSPGLICSSLYTYFLSERDSESAQDLLDKSRWIATSDDELAQRLRRTVTKAVIIHHLVTSSSPRDHHRCLNALR